MPGIARYKGSIYQVVNEIHYTWCYSHGVIDSPVTETCLIPASFSWHNFLMQRGNSICDISPRQLLQLLLSMAIVDAEFWGIFANLISAPHPRGSYRISEVDKICGDSPSSL